MVQSYLLAQRDAASRAAPPPYSSRRAVAEPLSDNHSARRYIALNTDGEYLPRSAFMTRADRCWRDGWKRHYTRVYQSSPYHEDARRTFDGAWARTYESLYGRDIRETKERAVECRQYRANIERIRLQTPVISDLYYAKYDPGIRIVPTDDRATCPGS
jgi:hypothetical protein